jgi:hypothetical protein
MYTRVAAWATIATPLPMWGVEGSGMVLLPNMVTDFRDNQLTVWFMAGIDPGDPFP